MSENNVDQQVQQVQQVQQAQPVQPVQEAQPAAEAPKKRVRVGFIFLSIVPVAVLLAIQSITQVPFLIIAALDITTSGSSTDPMEVSSKLLEVFNEKYAFIAYLLYAVVGLIVFSIWYYKGFVKKNPKVRDLSIRKWRCPECGCLHDRDINAAINILKKGMEVLAA